MSKLRGRKPYPYAVIEATNDKIRYTKAEMEKRHKAEPKIDSRLLRCPPRMSEEAKREWKRITKLYKELEEPIITDLDLNALEVYCEAVATYRKAISKVRETSEVYVGKNDTKPRKNPWLSIANEAAIQIKKYGESLLLDPVSRARAGLARSKADDDDPLAAFFARRANG